MNGYNRRQSLLNMIKTSSIPLSGSQLAAGLNVSRQVIVQDIALLRAADYDIISTNRGYLLNSRASARRIFHVRHRDEEIEEELNTIVDAGGKVIDVFVAHSVYGDLHAPLSIYSRNDIKKFINKLKSGEAAPLKNITNGNHFHTVDAYSEEILDDVGIALQEKGFLVTDNP